MRAPPFCLAVAVLALGCTRANPGFGDDRGTDSSPEESGSRTGSASGTSAGASSAASVSSTGPDSGPDVTTGVGGDCGFGLMPFDLVMPEMERVGAEGQCQEVVGMRRDAGQISICDPGCQAECNAVVADFGYLPPSQGFCFDVFVTYAAGKNEPPCEAETRAVVAGADVVGLGYNSDRPDRPFAGAVTMPFSVGLGAPGQACCAADPGCCPDETLAPGTHNLLVQGDQAPLAMIAHADFATVTTPVGMYVVEVINAALLPDTCRPTFSWKAQWLR